MRAASSAVTTMHTANGATTTYMTRGPLACTRDSMALPVPMVLPAPMAAAGGDSVAGADSTGRR